MTQTPKSASIPDGRAIIPNQRSDRLPIQRDSEPQRLNPVAHWARRLGKFVAAVVLIPPTLLSMLVFFAVWKRINRWKG